MAWLRDDTGQQHPIDDDDLKEEILVGSVRLDIEVRHPEWTGDRFQPLHSIAALQPTLHDPRALLAARMQARWWFPWGTLCLLAGFLLFIVVDPPLHRADLLDLGTGAGLRLEPRLQNLLNPLTREPRPFLLSLLVATAMLANLERAFGVAVFLTPVLLFGLPLVLLGEEVFQLNLLLFLGAATAGAALRHRRLLPWRWQGRYGLWYGLPLLLPLPVLLFAPLRALPWALAMAACAGMAAWIPPLPSLPPTRRRGHLFRHLATAAGVLGSVAVGIVYFGQHPSQFVAWEPTSLPPSGIVLQTPTLSSSRPSGRVLLHQTWADNEELHFTATMVLVGDAPPAVPEGAQVRTHIADGFLRQVTCHPNGHRWGVTLCADFLSRVSFGTPYTSKEIAAWSGWYATGSTAEARQLYAGGHSALAARILTDKGLDHGREGFMVGAELLATIWRTNPAQRPPDPQAALIRWFAEDLKTRRALSEGQLVEMEVGRLLREEPCEATWFRLRWEAPRTADEKHGMLLRALGCPGEAPAELSWALNGDLPVDHLERSLSALAQHSKVSSALPALRSLSAHYLHHRSCDDLGVALAERDLSAEHRYLILRQGGCDVSWP